MKIRLINDDNFEEMKGVKFPVEVPVDVDVNPDGWVAVSAYVLNLIGANFRCDSEVLIRPAAFEIIDDTPAPKAIDERELRQLSKDLLCSMVSGKQLFVLDHVYGGDEGVEINTEISQESIDAHADSAIALAKALLERI